MNFNKPNPYIPFDKLPIKIQEQTATWESESYLSGISGFGFGGTNCHMILGATPEFPENAANDQDRLSRAILNLSAPGEQGLEELRKSFYDQIERLDRDNLIRFCNLANLGRTGFSYRLSTHGANKRELLNNLTNTSVRHFTGKGKKANKRKLAFMFTGQGSQYFEMAKELYEQEVIFRQAFNRYETYLDGVITPKLSELVFDEKHREDIHLTCYAQPAIVAVQLGLVALLKSVGIEPALVLGHSLGEYTAAAVAGAFTEEETLKLVAERGRLMHSVETPGGMLNVSLEDQEEDIETLLTSYDQLEIAAYNGADQFVVSGELQQIEDFEKTHGASIQIKRLPVSTAFHSKLMEPILQPLESFADQIPVKSLEIPLLSTITGTLFGIGQRIYASHWSSGTRNPVKFHQCVTQFEKLKLSDVIEVGPKPVLVGLALTVPFKKEIVFHRTINSGVDSQAMFYDALSQIFCEGYTMKWDGDITAAVSQVIIPNYPFQKKTFKLEDSDVVAASRKEKVVEADIVTTLEQDQIDPEQVTEDVCNIISKLLMIERSSISLDDTFIEMGADSILLVTAIRRIEAKFKVNLKARQFFSELNNIENLVAYLVANSPVLVAQNKPKEIETDTFSTTGNGDDPVQDIVNRQLDIMQQQIELIKGIKNKTEISSTKPISREISEAVEAKNILPSWGVKQKSSSNLTDPQKDHVEQLIETYSSKTHLSKAYAKKHRIYLADNRASAGFRFSTKEMLYPVVSNKAKGAHLWDIDGNQYIDISMGFGVHLFGHQPEFITSALHNQIGDFMGLGPQSALSGETAALISKLTGHDRVMFSNSGTEAVMSALRLARTVSNRHKVVMFKNSYHGHFDGTLGQTSLDDQALTEPMASGITTGMVEDLIVLNYDDETSLRFIEANASEIAAVIVEPVQSREPGLQPRAFLKELRTITEAHKVILIFDEMITGFRVARGGAQEWFGIKADMATYGKIVGGGMPIGIVVGKHEIMDAVDGGQWKYGDGSFPAAETTFFAGTFSKHPLTLAASLSVLKNIEGLSEKDYQQLNERTAGLVARLNNYFTSVEAPFAVKHFGSLFRFEFQGNQDLFFYHLLNNGIYIWEGRNCFLSTAHTDEDIEKIYQAIVASIEALGAGGFLSLKPTGPIELPTTKAQQQLWRLSQVSRNGNIAYNIPTAIDFQEALDPDKLKEALSALLHRHEALRTKFDKNGSAQVILPKVSANIENLEVSDVKELSDLTYNKSHEAFDLHKAPLFRLCVLNSKQSTRILFVVHHSVADGISVQILLEELLKLYSASSAQLGEARGIRFWSDFQDEIRQNGIWEKEEKFWMDKLVEFQPLQLPVDYPKPQQHTFHGANCVKKMDSSLWSKARAMASQSGTTPFMVLLAVYALLLHKIGKSKSFLIGVPSTGRNFDGEAPLVAYCTHLLPLKVEIDEVKSTFSQVLSSVKQVLLDAFENPHYPFSEMVEKISDQSNLVNVTFNLDRVADSFDSSIRQVPLKHSFAKFDISLNLTERSGELTASLDYSRDMFEATTIDSLMDQYKFLLENCLKNPDMPLYNQDLLSSENRSLLLTNFKDREIVFDDQGTFIEQFLKRVGQRGDDPAVKFGETCLTYTQLDGLSTQLANQLVSVKPRDRVGLLLPRSSEMLIGILAVLKLRACFVPLEDLPDERVISILQESNCDTVVANEDLLGDKVMEAFKGDIHLSSFDYAEETSLNQLSIDPQPEDPAYILFTSGSTGRPKAVEVSNRALTNYVNGAVKEMSLPQGANYALVSSFGADLGFTMVFPCLAQGGCLHILDRALSMDALGVKTYFSQHSIDCLKIVPSHLKALLSGNDPERAIPRQRLVLGGEVCDVSFAKYLKDISGECRIFNHYGPTESTVGVLIGEYGQTEFPGSLLLEKVLPNNEAYVLNEHLKPVSIGEIGTLYVGGDNLSNGYINNDELTSELFINNPVEGGSARKLYCTGDLFRIRPNMKLQWVGRRDDQMKVRGYRVEPGEVEKQIELFEGIEQAVVAIHVKSNTPLTGYLVGNQSIKKSQLNAFLNGRLPHYMIPNQWIFVDQIPLKANGKVDRDKLLMLEVGDEKRTVEIPSTDTEQLIKEVWEAVLGVKDISVNDEYFSLGGDSIHSIQIAARLNEAGYNCKASDVYEFPSIKELANNIEKLASELSVNPVVGEVVLGPTQRRFFKYFGETPNHWNMSVLLSMNDGISSKKVKKAFEYLLRRHDIFRARFYHEEGEWKQHFGDEGVFTFSEIDLSNLEIDQYEEHREEVMREEQQRVVINSELIRLIWFDHKESSPQLFICIHHLLIDGVSWRLLMNDLQQLLSKEEGDISQLLGRKSASFAHWIEHANSLYNSKKLEFEKTYWEALHDIPKPAWPLPYVPVDSRLVKSEKALFKDLSPEETTRFIECCQQLGDNRIQEVLLTALTMTLGKVNKEEDALILVELEGHGRMSDIDLPETTGIIGWFTSHYPVYLHTGTTDFKEACDGISRQLKDVPKNNLSYSLLYHQDTEQSAVKPDIGFNYLGKIESGLPSDGPFQVEQFKCQGERSDESPMLYKISVEASIYEQCLSVEWKYSSDEHEHATVEEVADQFMRYLHEFMENGNNSQVDLSALDMDNEDFEDVLNLLE